MLFRNTQLYEYNIKYILIFSFFPDFINDLNNIVNVKLNILLLNYFDDCN